MTEGVAIKVNHLIKFYRDAAIAAVNDVSFEINRGMIFGLLGPNGAGKTTTLSILCGLLKQSAGEVELSGLHYEHQREEIKRMIGIVPQDIALYSSLSAVENLTYIGNMYGLKGKVLKDQIAGYLELFGLEKSKDKAIEEFSGGMKRRINLIAALLHKPDILFLDEPTAGVDVQSRSIIIEYLKEINKSGTTIVYTSHLMEEAENLCTHIAIMDEGRIIAGGTSADLLLKLESQSLEDVFIKLTGCHLRD